MISPEQIPTEVLNAFGNALLSRKPYDEALAAAINAWPGMWHIEPIAFEGKIILPLPTEKENTNGEG